MHRGSVGCRDGNRVAGVQVAALVLLGARSGCSGSAECAVVGDEVSDAAIDRLAMKIGA